uniref:Reverse transcriptase Ty1/copia-type domain-containing protein n=1 Tax=Solanum lycopersicum TaxID=4081 RepID=A0A3Q7G5E5_SOLLC
MVSLRSLADGLLLHQSKYIHDLLERSNMLTCNDIYTPMFPINELHNGDNTHFLDESIYRSIVCGLKYLSFTRPDITFSVNKLKSTSSHGILFSKQNSQQLQGYGVFFGSSFVSWCSYLYLVATTSELLWIRLLFKEIDLSSSFLPLLWCDNLSMEIDFHFIRYLIQKKELQVQYISSRDQLENILTRIIFLFMWKYTLGSTLQNTPTPEKECTLSVVMDRKSKGDEV